MSKRHGLILYVIIGICRLGCSSTLNYLTTALINDYEPSVRPVCPGFETTQVTVDMAIRQLISLNEPEQVALFNIWMRLYLCVNSERWISEMLYRQLGIVTTVNRSADSADGTDYVCVNRMLISEMLYRQFMICVNRSADF
ncbi:Hypothetical predicted protein [Mytilus galloprovincialis]|uniref:Neurotransmitter-gated ion-channel ligand-binding domain-containing protein n=1 Tax=Mytilus galloprovincialis TaxID=29158 RepID=A0A8B6GK50_MYTGA|nr:Hypothetical predicted protein [Mytilus galloprovincialis]